MGMFVAWGIPLLAQYYSDGPFERSGPGSQVAPWALIIGCALALLFLFLSLRAGRRRRLIDNIPTSKTSGVFIGLVEVTGSAESAGPLTSYLAEIPCVSYTWSVEEHWSRTVTETYTDSKGKTHTRTRHESGWKTVASGGEQQPFYLKDDCGVVLVRPDGAKVERERVFDQTCHPGDWLYYAKGPEWSVMDSDYRRQFSESAIAAARAALRDGQGRERQDVVAPEIAAADDAPVFLISTRSRAADQPGPRHSVLDLRRAGGGRGDGRDADRRQRRRLARLRGLDGGEHPHRRDGGRRVRAGLDARLGVDGLQLDCRSAADGDAGVVERGRATAAAGRLDSQSRRSRQGLPRARAGACRSPWRCCGRRFR